MKQGLASVEQIFLTEIVGKVQNLRFIFGNVEQISSLFLCQVLEIKLKPYLHYSLDMDNCSQMKMLQNLYVSYKSVTEVLGRMVKAGMEFGLDVEKTSAPLYNGLFAPFLRAYFEQEFTSLKRIFEGEIATCLEPLKVTLQRRRNNTRKRC